jgi:NRPS condensation-like uncharacterized protein
MKGRLNAFQKSMAEWDETHPYSAVHVVQLAGALETERLRSSIHTALAECGLTSLRLDRERFRFQYEPGPTDCEIRLLAGPGDPRCALVAEIEVQLNVPFDATQPFSPFRFLVAPAGDTFFLGLVYFHPMADAESIVWLLQNIVTCYRQRGACSPRDRPDLYPDSRARLLQRHPGVVARKLLSLPAHIRDLRRSHRASCREANEWTNGFTCFSLGPDDLGSLLAMKESWEVTVNDLLLALLLKSLSPCAAARERSRRRKRLSLGCIVNLRKDLGLDRKRAFGVFLGSFTVTHEVPEGISLHDLSVDVGRQTSRIKRHKLYLGTPLELGLARFAFRFFSPEQRRKLYAKHYPLWGGLTNMNLNSLWEPGGTNSPLDYFRGVSTGPVTPLVLSVTTVGDHVNLGLSYRTTVFSRADVENLQDRFRKPLEETRRDV